MIEPDERVFTLSDVRKLLRKCKKKIVRMALIGAACGFCIALVGAPKYQVSATFKEGADNQRSEGLAVRQLMGSIIGAPAEGQAVALMQSNRVIRPVIERLGLQATVPKKGILSKCCRRLWDNVRAEMGCHIDDLPLFVFQDVLYEGEEPLSYELCFSDCNHFSILDGKEVLASGTLGQEVRLPSAALTIAAAPRNLRLGRLYPLSIAPWVSVVEKIRSQLEIGSSMINKSIYTLSVSTPNRHFGVRLLNELMDQYRCYLKRDHDQVAQEQLAYLGQKQEEIYKTVSTVFDDYAASLQKSLASRGFLGLHEEALSITAAYQNLASRLGAIDLELHWIASMEQEKTMGAPGESSPFSGALQKVVGAIQDLKQQRDLLELSLQKNGLPAYADVRYQECKQELENIRGRRDVAQGLLERDASLLNGSLVQWASRLDEAQGEERQDLAAYLENYLRILSMQEKIAQERVFYEEDVPLELQGIDLETSRTLFVDYNKQLDESMAALSYFEQLNREIARSDFAISSLSTTLRDPLSQQLIKQASETLLQLSDEKHRSPKEGERWKEELCLQKKILVDHLDQLCEVERLKVDLTREKIGGLQQAALGCINGQISVLRERFRDLIREQRSMLTQEKKILENRRAELKCSFQEFPEQWRMEKWMEFKTELGMKMIGSMTELVESKTIGHHLHQVESKALDPAFLPLHPCRPGLFSTAILGALLASFGAVCQSLFRAILRGFPTSAEKLRAMRYPVLGEISPFCDGPAVTEFTGSDLELLRQVSLFVDEPPRGQVIGLIAGKGPDYSHAIGEHLGLKERRSLIIRCDFNAKFQTKDQPGLLQMWKGETDDLPIRRGRGYDIIFSGGFTPYGTELIQSETFRRLLERCKERYAAIFLLIRSPLDTAEPIAALSLCDKALVTAIAEPTEQLTPFARWAYHEGKCRLAFILTATQ